MSESYLSLQPKEQAQILRALSTDKNVRREAILLEKDIWLCWALEYLFKMPNRLSMAFKGGTSLSKAFRVIDRFSEDVDITIDYQSFDCGDPFEEGVSKTKIKNISARIKLMVAQHIKDVILPYYEKCILEQFKDNAPSVELDDDDDETLHLRYPSVLEQKSGYVVDSIRLEFGGRNLTIPSDEHIITTDVSEYLKTLTFPVAQVIVLSPQKTFWEKLTLIHYECNRPTLKDDANRISRHWYDVAKLANSHIGIQAIKSRNILLDVIKIKKTFYDSGFAKYDDCLHGNFCLIPNENYLKLLKEDFGKMITNKMFYGEQPDFEKVIAQVENLEREINKA